MAPRSNSSNRIALLRGGALLALAVLCCFGGTDSAASDVLSGPYTLKSQAGPDANGPGRCLIFSGNGNSLNPERYSWGNQPADGTTWCGFPSAAVLLDNRQAVFHFDLIPGTTDR